MADQRRSAPISPKFMRPRPISCVDPRKMMFSPVAQLPGAAPDAWFCCASFAGVCSFASHEIDRPVLLAQCNLAAHRCCQVQ